MICLCSITAVLAFLSIYALVMLTCFYGYKTGSLMYHPTEKEWQFWYGKKRVSNSVDVRMVRAKNIVMLFVKLVVQYKQVTK